MKILLITEDPKLISELGNILPAELELEVVNVNSNSLELVSKIFTNNFSIAIVDDDCLKSNSFEILKSIRTFKKNSKIIFLTSDTSIEKGRMISPLGILYYGIKPVSPREILEVLISTQKIISQ